MAAERKTYFSAYCLNCLPCGWVTISKIKVSFSLSPFRNHKPNTADWSALPAAFQRALLLAKQGHPHSGPAAWSNHPSDTELGELTFIWIREWSVMSFAQTAE